MKIVPTVAFAFPLLFAACKSTGRIKPATCVAETPVLAPVPEAQQPVVHVRIDDSSGGSDANVQVVRYEFAIPGYAGDANTKVPTAKALEYRLVAALNKTQRFRVPSYADVVEMQRLQLAGLIPPDPAKSWALKPNYMVSCTLIECNEEQSQSGDVSVPFFSTSKVRSTAVVKMAVKVTALPDGRSIWNGEAAGRQQNTSRRNTWHAPVVSGGNARSATPTLDDAVKLCINDLVTKLADCIPTLDVVAEPSAAVASRAGAAPAVGASAVRQ